MGPQPCLSESYGNAMVAMIRHNQDLRSCTPACLVITVAIWIRTCRTCCRGRRRRARSRLWTTHLWRSSWACDRTRSPAAASVTPRSHQASQTKPNFVKYSLLRSSFSTPHGHCSESRNPERSHIWFIDRFVLSMAFLGFRSSALSKGSVAQEGLKINQFSLYLRRWFSKSYN